MGFVLKLGVVISPFQSGCLQVFNFSFFKIKDGDSVEDLRKLMIFNTMDMGINGTADGGGDIGVIFKTRKVMVQSPINGISQTGTGRDSNVVGIRFGSSNRIAGVFYDYAGESEIGDENVGTVAKDSNGGILGCQESKETGKLRYRFGLNKYIGRTANF